MTAMLGLPDVAELSLYLYILAGALDTGPALLSSTAIRLAYTHSLAQGTIDPLEDPRCRIVHGTDLPVRPNPAFWQSSDGFPACERFCTALSLDAEVSCRMGGSCGAKV